MLFCLNFSIIVFELKKEGDLFMPFNEKHLRQRTYQSEYDEASRQRHQEAGKRRGEVAQREAVERQEQYIKDGKIYIGGGHWDTPEGIRRSHQEETNLDTEGVRDADAFNY